MTNGYWDRIKDLLPFQAEHPGASARDNRLFFDAEELGHISILDHLQAIQSLLPSSMVVAALGLKLHAAPINVKSAA